MGLQNMTSSEGQSKSIRTKAAILDAALDLMENHGFEQTTMRAIAQHAGLVASAAYYYFKSKDDLIMAYYDRLIERDAAAVTAILETATDFDSAFAAFIDHKFTEFKKQRSLLKFLISRSMSDAKGPASAFSEHNLESRRKMIALISRFAEKFPLDCEPAWQTMAPMMFWMVLLCGVFLFVNASDETNAKAQTIKMAKWVRQTMEASTLPNPNNVKTDILSVLTEISTKLSVSGSGQSSPM